MWPLSSRGGGAGHSHHKIKNDSGENYLYAPDLRFKSNKTYQWKKRLNLDSENM